MPIYALGEHAPRLPEAGRFWIAPDAQVIGRVELGCDVSVWFGAVLRGDGDRIVIGNGSNLQDGAILHVDPGFPVVIGCGCIIGHHAIVHGCTIGDDVLVGMGATVMNGAVIGASSIIGAGALVTEGKVFAERSLIVGAPARAIRTLDEAAVEGIREAARRYVENGRRFQAGLRPLG